MPQMYGYRLRTPETVTRVSHQNYQQLVVQAREGSKDGVGQVGAIRVASYCFLTPWKRSTHPHRPILSHGHSVFQFFAKASVLYRQDQSKRHTVVSETKQRRRSSADRRCCF